MHKDSVLLKVCELLRKNESIRAIAREVKISKDSVSLIARRTAYGRYPEKRGQTAVGATKHKRKPENDDERFTLPEGEATRCPHCGGMVFIWPCVCCEARGIYSPGPAKMLRKRLLANEQKAEHCRKSQILAMKQAEQPPSHPAVKKTVERRVG